MRIEFNRHLVRAVKIVFYAGFPVFVLYVVGVIWFVIFPESTVDTSIITKLMNYVIKVEGLMMAVIGFYVVTKMIKRK